MSLCSEFIVKFQCMNRISALALTKPSQILRHFQTNMFPVSKLISPVKLLTIIVGADIIALGGVFAVATCGGPIVPFRGGRIDAWTPGGFGTPEPQQDLDTLTESFRKQGFSNTEMITLTACGHTVGGVRDADFPMLVSASTTPGQPHIIDFDTTTQYDNKV